MPANGVSRSPQAMRQHRRPIPIAVKSNEEAMFDEDAEAAAASAQRDREKGESRAGTRAARGLFGCPARDERRGRKADEDDAELEEQKLQESAGRARSQGPGTPVEQDLMNCGEFWSWSMKPVRCAAKQKTEDADTQAPREGRAQVLADRTTERSAQADQRAREATASEPCS